MSELLAWLRTQKEHRGTLAQLRCALILAKEQRAWPMLARFGGLGSDHKGRVVRTIAGLYASHPVEGDTAMGTLCLRLCAESETPWADEKPGPMAKRMQHLLAGQSEEICERVMRLVLRAKTENLPVNYAQLKKDLLRWNGQGREKIRLEWARQFWTPAQKVAPDATATAEAEGDAP